jgi:hypothetical protein
MFILLPRNRIKKYFPFLGYQDKKININNTKLIGEKRKKLKMKKAGKFSGFFFE